MTGTQLEQNLAVLSELMKARHAEASASGSNPDSADPDGHKRPTKRS